jgi:hypothetical protein
MDNITNSIVTYIEPITISDKSGTQDIRTNETKHVETTSISEMSPSLDIMSTVTH